MVRRFSRAARHQSRCRQGRAHRDLRSFGFGQIDADPLHQCAGGISGRRGSSSTASSSGPNLRRVDEVRREVGMVFQSFNLFPHLTVLENCTLAPIWVRNIPKKDAEAAAHEISGAGEDPASGQQISGPDVGRPAAARRDRARADHESEGHAVRRADLGARSGNGQGSARHHGRSRQGGHDHAGGHPRNGICQGGGRIASCSWMPGRSSKTNTPANFFANPQHARSKLFLSQILR